MLRPTGTLRCFRTARVQFAGELLAHDTEHTPAPVGVSRQRPASDMKRTPNHSTLIASSEMTDSTLSHR